MKKKLKDICNGFTKNIAQKELDELNGDYEIYGASGLIKKIDYYVSEVPYIGIVKDGSGVGRVSSYPAKSSLIGTMQYIVPNNDIDLQYLMYALRSMNLGNLFKGAAIPHIYFKEYKEFNVNVPSLPDQQKIATHLDSIQSAIDNKKQQLRQLDELVKSKFVEMFGENPVESGKWKVEKLSSICKVQTGGTPSRMHPEYFEGNIPWITTANLGVNELNYDDAMEYITQEAVDNSATKIIPAHSLFIGIRVGVGKCSINNVDMCSNQDICGLSGFDVARTNLLFVKKVIDSYEDYFDNAKRGTTIKGVKSDTIKELKIFLPELELQNTFAEYVQKIDSAKSIIKTQLEDLQELLDSKMDEYFGE